jgi:hypothetical protein
MSAVHEFHTNTRMGANSSIRVLFVDGSPCLVGGEVTIHEFHTNTRMGARLL